MEIASDRTFEHGLDALVASEGRRPISRIRNQKREEFDFIIVGAGSAGCTLAMRLGSQGRVLLLEAGGWDRDPLIRIPLGWGRIIARRSHDWMYDSEPVSTLGRRRIECARGRIIGGSSSINGMVYARGHAADYDRWAANGLSDWSFDRVLPYFRRQESWENGSDSYRGGHGPLATRFARFPDPLAESSIAASVEAGHPATADYNGAEQHGAGLFQVSIRDGRRVSAADAYLRPGLRTGNITVRIGALASRVVFSGDRAVGVTYLRRGVENTAFCAREVILCGGAINTPQLLMLSGIGDPDRLGELGIAARAALYDVGKNLRDHVSINVTYLRRSPGVLHRALRADRVAREMTRAYFSGTGLATELPFGMMGFLKSDPACSLPDVQVMSIAGSIAARPYLAPFVRPQPDTFSWRIAVLRPESAGRVDLASEDPARAPLITQTLLATERDLRTMRGGIRLAQDISRQPPLADLIASSVHALRSDAEIDEHIRQSAGTIHHLAGTCRMGVDDHAVLDPELRVRGVEALRVVDASAMPDMVGGNINAPVIMIAEKAADIILGSGPSA